VFAVSEGVGSSFKDAHELVDEDRNELQMAYHFECVDMGVDVDNPQTVLQFKDVHSRWGDSFGEKGWLSIFLANHDLPRMVSRFGNDHPKFRVASAKLLNTFLMSMRGTPYCYFGDELGMTNINFDSIDEYKDIAAINGYKKALHKGDDLDKYMRNLKAFSRDNSRTPMQWNSLQNAGFSEGESWIQINQNFVTLNVQAQEQDPDSVLQHFRQMAQLRKGCLTLVYGDYELLEKDHPCLYIYKRVLGDEKLLVMLNFSSEQQSFNLSELALESSLLMNNYSELEVDDKTVLLKAYQAVIGRIC
jgi:oligo-1,6-glucosidase